MARQALTQCCRVEGLTNPAFRFISPAEDASQDQFVVLHRFPRVGAHAPFQNNVLGGAFWPRLEPLVEKSCHLVETTHKLQAQIIGQLTAEF